MTNAFRPLYLRKSYFNYLQRYEGSQQYISDVNGVLPMLTRLGEKPLSGGYVKNVEHSPLEIEGGWISLILYQKQI